MTNYVKSTNFTSKDALASGNPLKIVKGTEFDIEFNNIATAVATKADIINPALSGVPTAPTAATGNNTTQLATTAFVAAATTAAVAPKANTASPALTGVPTAPTATAGTNTTQLATTAFTTTAIATAVAPKANLASPTFTGVPAAPTAAAGTSTVQLATTAFVAAATTAAVATKANIASPTFTGVPAAPTAVAGTNTTQLATTAFVRAALLAIYPVGSIYTNAGVTTNPATLLGFGTWTAFGAGRVMVGLNGSDTLFDSLEETGGSKDAIVVSHTHTGTTSNAGQHFHTMPNVQGAVGSGFGYGASNDNTATVVNLTNSSGDHNHSLTTASTGSSGTNANLQPYITVAMWKRTA